MRWATDRLTRFEVGRPFLLYFVTYSPPTSWAAYSGVMSRW